MLQVGMRYLVHCSMALPLIALGQISNLQHFAFFFKTFRLWPSLIEILSEDQARLQNSHECYVIFLIFL